MSLFTDSSDSLQKEASSYLSHLFFRYKHDTVLFLVSGGSALKILDAVDTVHFDGCVTVGVLDERFSSDPDINNFAQLCRTDFYKKIQKKACRFIDTRPSHNETAQQLAQRWEAILHNWIDQNEDGIIISTQGIGPDGHTAGIMPYPENSKLFGELFEDQKKWITEYDAGDKNPFPLRITTTIPFLKTIDHTVVYAVGKNKRKYLEKIIKKEEIPLHEMPAAVLHKMKNVAIFTDQRFE